jgi:hypothetical protein
MEAALTRDCVMQTTYEPSSNSTARDYPQGLELAPSGRLMVKCLVHRFPLLETLIFATHAMMRYHRKDKQCQSSAGSHHIRAIPWDRFWLAQERAKQPFQNA